MSVLNINMNVTFNSLNHDLNSVWTSNCFQSPNSSNFSVFENKFISKMEASL